MADFEDTDLQEEETEEEASYDEQHALVAQSIEVNKLRQQVDLLKRANERVKDQYRQEIRTLLQPLIGKHKAVQDENLRLKKRLEEVSQIVPGEEGAADLEALGEEMSKLRYDNSVLQKVVDALENEVRQLRREAAEVEELRNALKGHGSESVQMQREVEALRQSLRDSENARAEQQERQQALQETLERVQAELGGKDQQHQDVLAGYQRQLGEAQHRLGNLQQQLAEWQSRAGEAEQVLKDELSATDDLVGILAEARRLLEPDDSEPAAAPVAGLAVTEPEMPVAAAAPAALAPERERAVDERVLLDDDAELLPIDEEAPATEVEASDDLENLMQLLNASQSDLLDDEEQETTP